jgi:hypothetical protein
MSEVLDNALSPEHRRMGFTLDEPDDHTLVLCYRGKEIARFSATGVTTAEIVETVDREASKN